LKLLSIAGYDWLPDGRTIVAMAADLQDRYGVHVIDTLSGVSTPVALATGVYEGTRFTGPQVAGSGRRAYYNRTPRGGPSVREAARAGRPTVAPIHAIMERDFDTGEERVFLAWSEIRTAEGAAFTSVRNVQVSPDGQWVVALATVSGSELWVVSIKDKSARPLALELESGPFPISNDIKWTPDGRAILVNLRRGTGREAIRSLWLVPVGGSRPVRLAIDLPIEDAAPDIHPDGRHIAFVSGGSRTREIRLLDGFLPTSAR
jgi:Tol biopolymer transport system component